MERKDRIIWVDALNIIACMGVLLLHCTNGQVHGFNGTISADWAIGLFTHSFFLWPVNVFFMLSGFTLIRQNIHMGGVIPFYKKRLNRLLVPVLFWNTFYMAMDLAIKWHKGLDMESPISIVEKFLSFQYNGFMWFFVPLIVIYLSLPFLSVFVLNAPRELLKTFIVIGVLLNCIAPLHSDFSSRMEFSDIYLFGTRFLLYVVAGYYFGTYSISVSTRKRLYILSLIFLPLMIIGTIFLQFNIPSHYKYFIQYINFPCTIISFAVFLMFKHIDWSKIMDRMKIDTGTMATISSLSLGIYLVQMLGFRVMNHIPIVSDYSLLLFVAMYVVSISMVWIMKHIPLVNKIL